MKSPAISFIYWLATRRLLAPLGRMLLSALNYALPLHGMYVASFRAEKRRILDVIVRTRRERKPNIRVDEAFFLATTVRATEAVGGDIAEVGVFQGSTAKLICELKGNRRLHLFDTFEGLPEPGALDKCFKAGDYSCGLESVREYLAGYPETYFYKGRFPFLPNLPGDRRFSLVHLDVDLYESTKAALEFFYPRLLRGGVLISHDYQSEPGVRLACDEFFAIKAETVLELIGTQCLVVKTVDFGRPAGRDAKVIDLSERVKGK